jgi:hypothetical protein
MADLFNLSDLGVTDAGFGGSGLKTGDIRRKYNFGDRVSELALASDPFFRFLSVASKNPTDDPSFKFTERRGSWHKRYAYAVGAVAWSSGSATGLTYVNTNFDAAGVQNDTLNTTYALKMATDYKSAGNVQNIYGQASNKIDIGSTGTQPTFFIKDQLLKVPVHSLKDSDGSADLGGVIGWQVVKVVQVEVSGEYAYLGVKIVKPHGLTKTATSTHFIVLGAAEWTSAATYQMVGNSVVHSKSIAGVLEAARSYVVGSAHAEGSGYPETWKDQPFSNNYGQTQIWKTAMAMTNTARATSLKYDSSEWARVWKEKLIEHKWDIEQSLLFGQQASGDDGVNYTQGAVDYVLSNGNIFGMDLATKSQDSFLDDLSSYIDPRYNNSQATIFFCDTATYNWLHKLSGYFANNIGMVNPGGSMTPSSSGLGRAEFAMGGKKKVFGVDVTTISSIYGDMNIARNIHLDGSDVKMLGINMKYCNYRPLSGNGVNRDTSVYVGVQTLENSGIDRRVDLILTEAGMQWEMPECHAIWK